MQIAQAAALAVAALAVLRSGAGGSSARWLAGSLLAAGGASASAALVEAPVGTADELAIKGVMLGLAIAPLAFVRLATGFEPVRWQLQGAEAVTVALVGGALVVPLENQRLDGLLLLWIAVLTGHWVTCAVAAVAALLHSADATPVSQPRHRILAVAVLAFTLGAILAAAGLRWGEGPEIAGGVLLGITAALFMAALSPPEPLRARWRRRADRDVRVASTELLAQLGANRPELQALPHVLGAIGGRGAILTAGTVADGLEFIGLTPREAVALAERLRLVPAGVDRLTAPDGLVAVRLASGWLAVLANPAASVFGEDDLDLLEQLGAVTELAVRTAAVHQLLQHLARAGSVEEVSDLIGGTARRLLPLEEVRLVSPRKDRAARPGGNGDPRRLDVEVPMASGDVEHLELVLDEGHLWTDDRREVANTLSALASIAIDRVDALATARRAARQDGLTGLPNRRAWDEALARLAAPGRAAKLVLAVVDLDRLKAVNDASGHMAGDRLLRTAADALVGAVRPSDIVARLGGDEFGLAFIDPANPTPARLRARLSEALEAVGVSASIGVATARSGSVDAVWQAADAAMYADKRRRRHGTGAEPAADLTDRDLVSVDRPSLLRRRS